MKVTKNATPSIAISVAMTVAIKLQVTSSPKITGS